MFLDLKLKVKITHVIRLFLDNNFTDDIYDENLKQRLAHYCINPTTSILTGSLSGPSISWYRRLIFERPSKMISSEDNKRLLSPSQRSVVPLSWNHAERFSLPSYEPYLERFISLDWLFHNIKRRFHIYWSGVYKVHVFTGKWWGIK